MLAAGCQKYDTLQPLSGAANIRIFNNIQNYAQTIANSKVLCVLVDPKEDASGHLGNALVTSDFMERRAIYAAPYETYPGDEIANYYNMEYPGAIRVHTGGVINGLDLGRWAQIASGSHRIVIMHRAVGGYANRDYFINMTPAAKDTVCRVAVDTTVMLEEGGIYTLEILNQSMTDAQPLQLRMRRETLDRQPFAADSMYVNFYNYLQSPGTPAALDVYYQMDYVTVTNVPLRFDNKTGVSVAISYSPIPSIGAGPQYTGIRTPEQKLTTITEKFAASAPYIAIPMPPVDSFYYKSGQGLGQFRLPMDQPHTILNFYLPGQSAATGAQPYLQRIGNAYYAKWITNINTLDNLRVSEGDAMPLYQVVTLDGATKAYPMITTIMLMNQMTTINQPSGKPTLFQTGLQRPY
jgi:hypothetical protein